jgi:hypothetical protein
MPAVSSASKTPDHTSGFSATGVSASCTARAPVARTRSTSSSGEDACRLQEQTAIGAFETGIRTL